MQSDLDRITTAVERGRAGEVELEYVVWSVKRSARSIDFALKHFGHDFERLAGDAAAKPR